MKGVIPSLAITFSLALSSLAASVPAQAAGGISATLDHHARLNPNGSITLSGTITCSPPYSSYLAGDLSQIRGSKAIDSFVGTSERVCTGLPQPWTATSMTGYRSGPANVNLGFNLDAQGPDSAFFGIKGRVAVSP